jgi:hypothetical protein
MRRRVGVAGLQNQTKTRVKHYLINIITIN